MQLTYTHILIIVCTLGILTVQGVLLWQPWRQYVPATLPATTITPSMGIIHTTPLVQTDYTRIINPADIETRITADEYARIDASMSYEDIVDIIGGTGLVLNRTVAGGQIFATYVYYGDDRGANANFTFQDDKLIARTSFGLK